MRVILTEEQFKQYIRHQIVETTGIRRWTDDDYKKANPNQIKDFDFAGSKRGDDEFKNLTGKKPEKPTAKSKYENPDSLAQAKIDIVQDKLSKRVSNDYAKEHNGETSIPFEKLGNYKGDKKIAQLLKQHGLQVGIGGKTFSYGNTKLPENIMVINLTSAWNCPSIATGECPLGKICYARKGESMYQHSQIRNLRNQFILPQLTIKELLELLETYIEQAPARIKYIRISEDGDFPDQETVDLCDKLAGHFMAKYGIQTTAYTHRHLDYTNCKNMIINMSDLSITGGDRYYLVASPKQWEKIPEGYDSDNGIFKCHCDCRQCSFCYQTKEQNGENQDVITKIYVEKH